MFGIREWVGDMVRAVKWYNNVRHLRMLHGYHYSLVNWEKEKAAIGLPTNRPEWVNQAIPACEKQIAETTLALDALYPV